MIPGRHEIVIALSSVIGLRQTSVMTVIQSIYRIILALSGEAGLREAQCLGHSTGCIRYTSRIRVIRLPINSIKC